MSVKEAEIKWNCWQSVKFPFQFQAEKLSPSFSGFATVVSGLQWLRKGETVVLAFPPAFHNWSQRTTSGLADGLLEADCTALEGGPCQF